MGAPDAHRGMGVHLVAAITAVLALVVMLLGDTALAWARYDRNGILAGQLWRLGSAHLAHLTWSHLWMNLAALGLAHALFARLLSAPRWLLVNLVSAVGVSLGLLIFDPWLHWYVGLSGVLHGVFMAGIIASLRSGYRIEWVLLILLTAKLIYEQLYGPMAGTAELAGGPVIVQAHLYGAISGALVSGVWAWRDCRPKPRRF